MSNKLYELIAAQIRLNGPVSVATYMDLCLSHPEYGYYRRRDPLGAAGDFITAPEISQLFGEMIGIWAADIVMKLGNPKKIILCELGPGRGTLMKDILRVLSKLPGLNIEVHLVEISEVLKEKQKAALGEINWHESVETLPADAPVIFIANEFFDALPFRQAVGTKAGWQEAVVGLQDDKFAFGLGYILTGSDMPEVAEGNVYEFSPTREAVWIQILERVHEQKGAILAIDYGHLEVKMGGTFQAVKNHAYANVLENPGEQDLTSHVDFAKLKQLAGDLQVDYFCTQGEFLENMGIEVRTENLAKSNPSLHDDIMAGSRRLVHSDEMGNLFKVIGISKCS